MVLVRRDAAEEVGCFKGDQIINRRLFVPHCCIYARFHPLLRFLLSYKSIGEV
jgi:hypothetical protein